MASLSSEPVLLVQSGLYPHAGYDGRVQLLTPDAVADPRNAGAAILLAPAIGAYPFSAEELTALTRLPAVRANDDGVMVVRLVK